MSEPVSLSLAQAVQLADGTWYPLVVGSLGAVIGASFTDPLDNNRVITPGDNWLQFTSSADGVTYAAPFRAVMAVKLNIPVQDLVVTAGLATGTGAAQDAV